MNATPTRASDIGSYQVAAEYRDLPSELARLEQQVALSWDKELRLLQALGLRDGMRLLDLGAGPGIVAERLRERFPQLQITLVEQDELMVRAARARLGAGGGITIHPASAYHTGLPGAHFDFVLARYLFQHLSDPPRALVEAHRLLVPGGRVAVLDVDDMLWGVASPYNPALTDLYIRGGVAQRDRGGNRMIGRALYRLLRAASFDPVGLEAILYHSDELGLPPFEPQISPDRLLVAVRSGAISVTEYATAQAAHTRFMSNPNAFVLMVGLLAWGEKPTC